jgi:cytochrome c oxidase subunit 3
MSQATGGYYVPHVARWPIVGSVGLTVTAFGFASYLNGASTSSLIMVGLAIIAVMMFFWFGEVVRESERGTYNNQVDMSFRIGMGWFIFSEVMFFAAFFGALFYAREYSVPWLSAEGANAVSNALLWPGYEGMWPTNGPGNVGGEFGTIPAWGVPAINTLILLSSGVTVTWAHWALKEEKRGQLIAGLLATVVLGFGFVYLQAQEYGEAYHHLNLTLGSGIYGSTFFMLTGFHGFHVTMGALMLTVILLRALFGHFSPKRHFAFEAVAWYWHFVDVVWLGLFIFVYWF